MDYEENEARRVQARFVTKLKSPFKVPKTTLAIPANVTRIALSDIVNSLLRSQDPEWKGEPFDFLIEGKLIRSKLEEFLAAKKISTEKVLEIEYIKAVTPREEEEPSLHDDWVSAVDGSCSRFIFTGCYDGLGRLWKAAGECTHILEGHTDAITSVSVVNPEGKGIVTLATASKDQTLRLWKVDGDLYGDSPARIRAFKVLRGHSASVQSVAAQASGRMVCSGSFDCTISLWETSQSDAQTDSVSIKKRKVKKDVEECQLEGEAVSTLTGHTQRVTSVVWPVNDTIYSASWDHSIRKWDVETGKDILNLFCGKALNCVHVGGEGSALIAAGGSDHILRIWDPRMPGTSAPIFKLSSHKSWISACKWHSKSLFHLVSSSYDGKLLLWDLRAADSFLNDMDSHEDKVLCADWWKGDSIVSGGADSKLCIFSDISVC